jgi:hypothetical protein
MLLQPVILGLIIAKLSPNSSFSWAEFSFNFNSTPPNHPPPSTTGKVVKLEI